MTPFGRGGVCSSAVEQFTLPMPVHCAAAWATEAGLVRAHAPLVAAASASKRHALPRTPSTAFWLEFVHKRTAASPREYEYKTEPPGPSVEAASNHGTHRLVGSVVEAENERRGRCAAAYSFATANKAYQLIMEYKSVV